MKKIALIALLCIVCIGSVFAEDEKSPERFLFNKDITAENVLDALTYYYGDLYDFSLISKDTEDFYIEARYKKSDKGIIYILLVHSAGMCEIKGYSTKLVNYKFESNPILFLDLICERGGLFIKPVEVKSDSYNIMSIGTYTFRGYFDILCFAVTLQLMTVEFDGFVEYATKELDYAVKYGAMELR